jgi:hypothetical protein
MSRRANLPHALRHVNERLIATLGAYDDQSGVLVQVFDKQGFPCALAHPAATVAPSGGLW